MRGIIEREEGVRMRELKRKSEGGGGGREIEGTRSQPFKLCCLSANFSHPPAHFHKLTHTHTHTHTHTLALTHIMHLVDVRTFSLGQTFNLYSAQCSVVSMARGGVYFQVEGEMATSDSNCMLKVGYSFPFPPVWLQA